MGAGFYAAPLLSSIFTGLGEGSVQLLMPWVVALAADMKGARTGTLQMFTGVCAVRARLLILTGVWFSGIRASVVEH